MGTAMTTPVPRSVPLQAEPRALGLKVTDTGVPLWLRASWHLLCLSFPIRLWEIPVLRGDKAFPQAGWYRRGTIPHGMCVPSRGAWPQCRYPVPSVCPVMLGVPGPGVCPQCGCPYPAQVPGADPQSPACSKSVPTVPSECPRCVPSVCARSQYGFPVQIPGPSPSRRCRHPNPRARSPDPVGVPGACPCSPDHDPGPDARLRCRCPALRAYR